MKLFPALIFILGIATIIFAQDRSMALDEFNNLKTKAASLETIILAPERSDFDVAAKDNLNVFRILPRETYDNSYASTRGGGAYYSFYYRYHDYGHGSDLALEQSYLSTASDLGLMADLGDIPLTELSIETDAASELSNYRNSKYTDVEKDRTLVRNGLKLGGTTFNNRLSLVVGHSYILRSINVGYYDVLVGFRIFRKDSDGSLIIFWKMLDQFNTQTRGETIPKRNDAELQKRLTEITDRDICFGVRVEVKDGVVILRGTIDRKSLPYIVQLATSAGSIKVVNSLDVK